MNEDKKKMIDKLNAKLTGQLDQEWAKAVDWVQRSDHFALADLQLSLLAEGEDLREVFSEMNDSHRNIVSRLALLALGEAFSRSRAPTAEKGGG